MELKDYLSSNRSQKLALVINGESIKGVHFRRLSAGEGLQLKQAFSELIENAGKAAADLANGNAEEAGKKAAANLSPAQLRAMFEFQALFTFLHLGDADGDRLFTDRAEFDKSIPDDFVQAFYTAGSELKAATEATQEGAEKN